MLYRYCKQLSSHSVRSRRALTTATSHAIQKLQIAVEKFRVENYAYELPSRCKKEIVKAADKQGNGHISIESFQTLLNNIGASGSMTKGDIDTIISELGDTSKSTISADKVLKMI